MENRIPSMKYIDKKTGETYELDFTRESVMFAEARGFKIADTADFPVTGLIDLFFYALRARHKSVSKEKAQKMLDALGGLTRPALNRLIELYNQAASSNLIQDEEELEKNEAAGLEL